MSICRGIYHKRVKGNPYLSFRAKYKVNPTNGCWEWQASLNENGYGQLNLGNHKMILSHRYSFKVYIGEPDNMFVCHRCDNPCCVNPFHLFLGTNTDNMQDASKKGRLAKIGHPSLSHYGKGCRCADCCRLQADASRGYRLKKYEQVRIKKKAYFERTYIPSIRILTSSHKGISFDRSRNKWRAKYKGKMLGTFNSEQEAYSHYISVTNNPAPPTA